MELIEKALEMRPDNYTLPYTPKDWAFTSRANTRKRLKYSKKAGI
jgi:hypothetical protein